MRDAIEATAGVTQSAFLAQVKAGVGVRAERGGDASDGNRSGDASSIVDATRKVQATPAPVKSKRSDADTRDDRKPANGADAPAKTKAASQKNATRDEAVKVEIRNFDVGRSPAEIVGTRDVVQRFDENSDGRIDQFESQAAVRARDDSSTYGGVAAISELNKVSQKSAGPAPGAIAKPDTSSVRSDFSSDSVATRLGTPTAPDLPTLDGQGERPFESTGPSARFAPDEKEASTYDALVGDDEPAAPLPGEERFEETAQKLAGEQPRKLFGDAAEDAGEPRKLFAGEDGDAGKLFGDEADAGERKLFDGEAEVGDQKLFGDEAVSEERKLYGDAAQDGKLYDGEEPAARKIFGTEGAEDARLFGDEAVEDEERLYDEVVSGEQKLYSDEEIAEEFEDTSVAGAALPGSDDDDAAAEEAALPEKLYDDEQAAQQQKLYGELTAYDSLGAVNTAAPVVPGGTSITA